MAAPKSFGTGSSEKAALEASATRSTESFAATNTGRDYHDSSGAKRRIEVTIRADARSLVKGLKRAELRCSRSFWRRLRLRFDLWRLRDD